MLQTQNPGQALDASILRVSVHLPVAESQLGPSTPASSTISKSVANTNGTYLSFFGVTGGANPRKSGGKKPRLHGSKRDTAALTAIR